LLIGLAPNALGMENNTRNIMLYIVVIGGCDICGGVNKIITLFNQNIKNITMYNIILIM